MAFIKKLFEDDTLPGLHIEPIKGSIDPKVRTGRVNDMYRAVLFKVQSSAGEPHYIFTGVWPHDEAIEHRREGSAQDQPGQRAARAADGGDRPEVQADARPRHRPAAPTSRLEGACVAGAVAAVPGVGQRRHQPRAAHRRARPRRRTWRAVPWPRPPRTSCSSSRRVPSSGRASHSSSSPPAPPSSRSERASASTPWPTWSRSEDRGRPAPRRAQDPRRQDAVCLARGRRGAARRHRGRRLRRLEESSCTPSSASTSRDPLQRRLPALRWSRHRQDRGAPAPRAFLAKRDPQARIVLTTYTRTLADAMKRDLLSSTRTSSSRQRSVSRASSSPASTRPRAPCCHRPDPAALDAAVEKVLGVGGNRANRRNTNEAAVLARSRRSPQGRRCPRSCGARRSSSRSTTPSCCPTASPRRTTTCGCAARDEASRSGAAQRARVWDVVSAYRVLSCCRKAWSTSGRSAQSQPRSSTMPPLRRQAGFADHVLVDEGQDLTAARWQFLRSLVAEGPNDLFIAEDAQQRIYGQRITLGATGSDRRPVTPAVAELPDDPPGAAVRYGRPRRCRTSRSRRRSRRLLHIPLRTQRPSSRSA